MDKPPVGVKVVRAVLIGLLVAFLGYVFVEARWYVFGLRIHDHLRDAVSATPEVKDVARVPDQVRVIADRLRLDPKALAIELRFVQHDSRGRALKEDISAMYWFLVVDARLGNRRTTWERRIDNTICDTHAEELAKLGVEIRRAQPKQ